jgi:hypothetical protein
MRFACITANSGGKPLSINALAAILGAETCSAIAQLLQRTRMVQV